MKSGAMNPNMVACAVYAMAVTAQVGGAVLSSSDGVEIRRDGLTCLETGKKSQQMPWEGWTCVNYCNRQKIEPGRIVDGVKTLYIGGPTGKCDTAWRALSPRLAVPSGAIRCFLSFDVEAHCALPETDGKIAGWNNLFFWYGADGSDVGIESMRYTTEKAGMSHIHASAVVPPGVAFVAVQFGLDKPDVGVGERMLYRNIEISFSDGTPAYVREGRYVSAIREGGRISWTADVPVGTEVQFRARGGSDAKALLKSGFAGPDNTSRTFYTEPFDVRLPYVQYEARLLSAPGRTPRLKSVCVGNVEDGDWMPLKDRIAPRVEVASETPTTNQSMRLRLKVTDESCVDWQSVKVSVDGKDITAGLSRKGDELIQAGGAAPMWKDGLHQIVAAAADMQGNAATNKLAFFIGAKPDVPPMTLRDDGMVLVGGKPFFPIGAYGVCRREFNGMDLDAAFEGLKAAGFNFAHTYGNSYDPEFLAAARKYGFKLWVGGRCLNRNFLETGRGNPDILAWYIGDDTSANTKPEELRAYHDSLKAVDPYRLTCHADVIFSDRSISNFAPYVTGADVFMPEIYPVLGAEGDPRDEICVAVTIRDMAGVHREMRDFGDGRTRAVWPIMQWFKGWTGWLHFPTKEQLFATSFAAIANGANGITWYTYGGFYDKKRKTHNEGMTSTPDRWRDMCELATWLQELSPVLLERTGAQPPPAEVLSGPANNKLGGPTVTALLKRHGGKAHLIAVNATTAKVRARFQLDGVGERADVLREDRKIKCGGGILEDDFGPIAVHIYRLEDKTSTR